MTLFHMLDAKWLKLCSSQTRLGLVEVDIEWAVPGRNILWKYFFVFHCERLASVTLLIKTNILGKLF